jgi:hypothetical protein
MTSKVYMCIQRFGRQSIDMVFDQIKHEQLNLNKNGFVPDFDFIFNLKQYEIYLERYKMRIGRKSQPQQDAGVIIETPVAPVKSQEEYERDMRDYAKQHPDSRPAKIVAAWDEKRQQVTV